MVPDGMLNYRKHAWHVMYDLRNQRRKRPATYTLTTTRVKNVSLPVGGSEPFTAFLCRSSPCYLPCSYFLPSLVIIFHYFLSQPISSS